MKAAKIRRNDPCSCGSGRKFKRCCEAKTAQSRSSLIWMIVVAAAMLGGIAAAVASFRSDSSGSTGVWSQEHGHYHDTGGVAVP